MNSAPSSTTAPSSRRREWTRPPTRSRASKTVTSAPGVASASAAARPARPAPITTTLRASKRSAIALVEQVRKLVLLGVDAVREGARAHSLLHTLAHHVVLVRDKLRELDGFGGVEPRRLDDLGPEPVVRDDRGVVGPARKHARRDHDRPGQVDEHVREDARAVHRVRLLLGQAWHDGKRRRPRGGVTGALHRDAPVVTTLLEDEALAEGRRDGDELRVDGRTVEALVVVLDEDLPISPQLCHGSARSAQLVHPPGLVHQGLVALMLERVANTLLRLAEVD